MNPRFSPTTETTLPRLPIFLIQMPFLDSIVCFPICPFPPKRSHNAMPLSFSPLLNGERAVVVLFVGAIVTSLPLSLYLHGVVLCLLSLFALSVEIYSENYSSVSQRFKTRPGASSGILLGAVTLPAVMLSKLIQLTRGFALDRIQLQDVNYVELQYWAVLASCFAVLLFLSVVNWDSFESSGLDLRRQKLGLCCGVAFSPVLLFLLSIGSDLRIQLLWVLFHGAAAVILVLHLVNTFPSCASIGEALLVTAGLVLYFGDMLASTIIKVYEYSASSESVSKQYGIKRSEIGTIIQGLLLGLLIFPVVFKFILHAWNFVTRATRSEVMTPNDKGKSFLFFGSLVLIMTVVVPLWIQFVLDFHVHPISWVLIFVFSEPFKRLSLCIYWICVIYVSVLRFYHISKNSKIERILLRKYYHLMAVLMFLPAVIFQPKFLDLAFGVALSVFLALEIIRVWRIWPLGHIIHKFMNAFTDHRDSDILIVSHFSLLLGCALPFWMSSGYNDRPLAPFAGILSLGIGDTMASMVGHKYGVLRWSKTGKKTIEGTAAGITSVLAACSVLLPLFASTGYILSQHWVSLLLAVVVSGMLEAYTAQLDNAFIPLVFYSLLCL